MKRADAEFLREYYSSFTLDYENVVEQLFMNRLYLAGSVCLNLLLMCALVVWSLL